MANIILFHSILGLRAGVKKTAERLNENGHKVYTPDLMNGEIFEEEFSATRRYQEIGIAEMMRRARTALQGYPEDAFYAGFSFGGVCALAFSATRKGARGCIALHAAVPPNALGMKEWPAYVPVQVHFADRDIWRNQENIDLLKKSVKDSGSIFEYFGYPLGGHLFTDPDMPEYNPDASGQLWQRVDRFLSS
ncbi:MAG: dienelactone hydrolase family protein [Brevinematales bacterium]